MQKFYIFIFITALLLLFCIWLFLASETAVIKASGEITQKVYKEPSVYSHSNAGINRGFQSNTNIQLAENYVLVIKIEGEKKEAAYGLNTILAKNFSVGQKIQLEYQKKGIPYIWEYIRVTSVK